MRLFLVGVLLTVQQLSPVPAVDTQPKWAQIAQHHRNELIALNGQGSNARLKEEIASLSRGDQNGRALIAPVPTDPTEPSDMRVYVEPANGTPMSDSERTKQLKLIVSKSGWPTIAEVGIEASNGALVMLKHSGDHQWQRSLLPELRQLADKNQLDISVLALIIDDLLIASGRPQFYGTQFKSFRSRKVLYEVVDPPQLDARRASAFLPPIGVYK